MKQCFLLLCFCFFFLLGKAQSVPAMAGAMKGEENSGWKWWVSRNGSYFFDRDVQSGRNGGNVLTIKSQKIQKKLFVKSREGALVKEVDADNLRGKTVKVSGYLKTRNIKGRVKAEMALCKGSGSPCKFFPLSKITRDQEWKQFETTFEVSKFAKTLTLSVALKGEGQVWLEDIKLEIVK